ncbi:ribulose-phosphate 3-epimerase [Vagococcus fluvialis]|uniref:Ribulose phosphate epimerase n=1 Tax=Vagococcus fluvialis TaxID=2738 RepID=A0A369APX0_9ENTE|nr:ribulose-phosphate 3-epimerase [Vagococcus fluvialis]RCX10388.1 ribulose-phosphate 3-epimerase [Vagococcus fluvialis]RST98654.1 ribulose phosphate epimerase [Vagococcus fluvialis]
MSSITLSPSIMCGDLVNLEKSIKEIERAGFTTLHIDVIDGAFSPSMPLGLETIKRMREVTDLNFDVHIMSVNNEFFINEVLSIGVQSVTFHCETALHIDRYIQLVKNSGANCGIALNPATNFNDLKWILPDLDLICLMLINPGFANFKNEKAVPYGVKKVKELNLFLKNHKADVAIQVDGRVSLDVIPELVKAGANNLVLGSKSLFRKGYSIEENRKSIVDSLNEIEGIYYELQ